VVPRRPACETILFEKYRNSKMKTPFHELH